MSVIGAHRRCDQPLGNGGAHARPDRADCDPQDFVSFLRLWAFVRAAESRPSVADSQANQLLPGGPAAFHARLKQLRGYPIVINKWASWCGPCQTEFPAYQRASVALGKQVAFIGVDGKDADASASAFLQRFPVSYPSYVDPREAIARTIRAATYYPQTVYFDKRGKPVFDHAGPYTSASALERDIRRYVLG